MTEATWTRHARQRAAQRAIPEFHLEILHAFGETIEQKDGCVVLRLAIDRRDHLRRLLSDALAHWDQLQDAYAVVAPAGQVITVAHANASKRRLGRRRRTQPRAVNRYA